MPKYPGQIDDTTSLPTAIDNVTPVRGLIFNRLRGATLAIEQELGVKPSGTYGTVRGRLDALEGIIGNLEIIDLSGDLGGTLDTPKVIGIQGRPISNVAPAISDILGWNGIAWIPTPFNNPGNITLGDILRSGNTSDGYDIVLSDGSKITSGLSDNVLLQSNNSILLSSIDNIELNASADVIITGTTGIFMQNPVSLQTNKIINLGNPTLAQDAATKAYVDAQVVSASSLENTLKIGNDADGYRIVNLSDPIGLQDAVTKIYVDSKDLFNILAVDNSADGYRIINLGTPISTQDAATKGYVDGYVHDLNAVLSAGNNATNHRITNLSNPSSAQDAATKFYVDGYVHGLNNVVAVNNSADSNRIIDLANPINAQDAVTKTYVDGYIFTTPNDLSGTPQTLSATHVNQYLRLNHSSGIVFNIPTNATTAFSVGTEICGIQTGAGQITFTPAGGVTINSPESLKTRKQYSTWSLKKVATNTWDLAGDLELA